LHYRPAEIDGRRFVDGVAALPSGEVEPARLDALLGLWRGNPWERDSQVPSACWSEVRSSLQRLLRRVGALTAAQRAELDRLPALQQHLAGTELLDELGRATQPAKPQVLIVDDQIGPELADVLTSEYDCEVIESLKSWNQRVKKGLPFRHVCALVDLHLKSDMMDGEGLKVVEELKQLSTMPIVLFSAELPPFEDYESLRRKYGVQQVMAKHNRKNGDLRPVGRVVQELIRKRQPVAGR
jgi:CheY-like chemotaxis protein